jgi:YhcH/YjgK/YiaL family protein
MIFDYIEQWPLYFSGKVFIDTFEKLQEIFDSSPTPGEYALEGYDIFFKVLSYDTKSADWITESHKNYVDIQVVTEGVEGIRLYEKNDLEIQTAYNSDNDCEFYKMPATSLIYNEVLLRPGCMGIFFPQDVHMTQIAPMQIQKIKKIVIKVNEKYFSCLVA